MAMEGDHVEILALAQALDISMHIVSMDGEQEHLAHHIIPEGAEPSLHLLHHSSHYNILYLLPSQNWPEIQQDTEKVRPEETIMELYICIKSCSVWNWSTRYKPEYVKTSQKSYKCCCCYSKDFCVF